MITEQFSEVYSLTDLSKLVKTNAKFIKKLIDAGFDFSMVSNYGGSRYNRSSYNLKIQKLKNVNILHIALVESKVDLVNVLLQKYDLEEEHLVILPLLSNFEVTMSFLDHYFSYNSYEIQKYVIDQKLLLCYLMNNKASLTEQLFNKIFLSSQCQKELLEQVLVSEDQSGYTLLHYIVIKNSSKLFLTFCQLIEQNFGSLSPIFQEFARENENGISPLLLAKVEARYEYLIFYRVYSEQRIPKELFNQDALDMFNESSSLKIKDQILEKVEQNQYNKVYCKQVFHSYIFIIYRLLTLRNNLLKLSQPILSNSRVKSPDTEVIENILFKTFYSKYNEQTDINIRGTIKMLQDLNQFSVFQVFTRLYPQEMINYWCSYGAGNFYVQEKYLLDILLSLKCAENQQSRINQYLQYNFRNQFLSDESIELISEIVQNYYQPVEITEQMKITLYRNVMVCAVNSGFNDIYEISSVILRIYPEIALETIQTLNNQTTTLLQTVYLFNIEYMDYLLYQKNSQINNFISKFIVNFIQNDSYEDNYHLQHITEFLIYFHLLPYDAQKTLGDNCRNMINDHMNDILEKTFTDSNFSNSQIRIWFFKLLKQLNYETSSNLCCMQQTQNFFSLQNSKAVGQKIINCLIVSFCKIELNIKVDQQQLYTKLQQICDDFLESYSQLKWIRNQSHIPVIVYVIMAMNFLEYIFYIEDEFQKTFNHLYFDIGEKVQFQMVFFKPFEKKFVTTEEIDNQLRIIINAPFTFPQCNKIKSFAELNTFQIVMPKQEISQHILTVEREILIFNIKNYFEENKSAKRIITRDGNAMPIIQTLSQNIMNAEMDSLRLIQKNLNDFFRGINPRENATYEGAVKCLQTLYSQPQIMGDFDINDQQSILSLVYGDTNPMSNQEEEIFEKLQSDQEFQIEMKLPELGVQNTLDKTCCLFEFFELVPPSQLDIVFSYSSQNQYHNYISTKYLLKSIDDDLKRYAQNFNKFTQSLKKKNALSMKQLMKKQRSKPVMIPFTTENTKLITRKEFFPTYPLHIFTKMSQSIGWIAEQLDVRVPTRINVLSFFKVVICGIYSIYGKSNEITKSHPELGNITCLRFSHVLDSLMQKSLLGKFLRTIIKNDVKEFTDLLSSITAVYINFEQVNSKSQQSVQKIWRSLKMDNKFNIIDQVLRYGKTTYKLYKNILIVTIKVCQFASNFDKFVDMYSDKKITQRNVSQTMDSPLKEYFALVANEEVSSKDIME